MISLASVGCKQMLYARVDERDAPAVEKLATGR
jgi:hypothetical protein